MSLNEWSVVEKGVGFGGIQITYIREQMAAEISLNISQDLSKTALKISRSLRYTFGRGHWLVVLIKGKHAKKFACSCNHYCVLQRKDGLRAYVWLNRMVSSKQERSMNCSFSRCKNDQSIRNQRFYEYVRIKKTRFCLRFIQLAKLYKL